MEYIGDSTYKMKSGRQFYANQGIIGIAPDMICISEGYDGSVHSREYDVYEPDYDNCHYYTKEELHEIADYMIDLWKRFKEDL